MLSKVLNMILPILLFLIFGFVCADEVQPSKCDDCYLKHYEVKGCTPVYENGSDCPVRYNCPEKKVDPSVCLFKGKSYKKGESIDSQNPCIPGCHCFHGFGDDEEAADISCAQFGCGRAIRFNETCYRARKENECCNYFQCPDEASEKIVCDYDGKKYRYGEEIEVGKRKTCICNERWSGPDGASCRNIGCFSLDKSERDLRNGCIPIYYENICCPIEILCGKYYEVTTKSLATKEDIDSGDTCIFKDTHFKRGQTLDYEGKSSCVTCTCDTPPDFTCIQRTCPQLPEGRCETKFVPGQCCPNVICGR